MQENRILTQKYKIAIVSQASGGIYTHVKNIISHLNKDKFDLEMIVPEGNLVELAKEYNIKFQICKMKRNVSPFSDINAIVHLIQIFKKGQFDIIHLHSGKAGLLGRLAQLFHQNSKLVFTPNAFSYLSCTNLFTRWLFLMIEKSLRLLTDLLIVVSHSEKKRALDEVGYDINKVSQVNNSIEANFQLLNCEAKNDPFEVIMIARPSFQKNCIMFLRVAQKIITLRKQTKFLLVNAGNYSPQTDLIRYLIKQMGLLNNVKIVDWSDEATLNYYIDNSKILVSTSLYEGLPYSLLQAMRLKKPIVATYVDGNRDIVQDGYNGFLVDIDDDYLMATKIITLLDDLKLQCIMGENGYNRLIEYFNSAFNVKQLEIVYEECLRKN